MKNFVITFFLFAFLSSFAQQKGEKLFYHDVSVDYGLFASLNSHLHEKLAGNRLNFQTAYYFVNNMGIRTGISSINNLEGSNTFYSVPVQFIYRTPIDKSFMVGGRVESIGELIFKIIIGLIPRQTEFSLGTNLGYIRPNNGLKLVSYNDGLWIEEGYEIQQRFISSVDIGLRLTYKLKRFGILISPVTSYILTQNFIYYSEAGFDHGYTPKWFLSATIGLAYQF